MAVDLRAQIYRLKHLLPESRKSEFWDQKVAFSFAEVEDNPAAVERSAETFLRAPGTHVRGYRSTVDGQVQHYWIHVPEKALRSENFLPLVIALPYTTGSNLAFLESYFLAAFDETERYRALGDEYGFAVLQVWGRGNYYGGTAIGTTDVLEALDAVRRDYPIDADRIYLMGYCEAGRIAPCWLSVIRDRFAALSVEAPITALHGRPPITDRWMRYSSPITEVENLRNTPVFISHDEADAPPIQESVSFTSRAKEAGVDVSLVRVHGGYHGFYQNPMAEKRSLFEFFRGKQRISTAGAVVGKNADQRFGVSKGPIEAAFGAPILIVEGTLGTPAQREVVHGVVEELRTWRNAYFVADCRVKRDTDVSSADIQKYNLIVVGDRHTNSLVARMGEHLPVLAAVDRLSLAGKTYQGDHLGYAFVHPNPLNARRYVVVIGMNQWEAAKGGS